MRPGTGRPAGALLHQFRPALAEQLDGLLAVAGGVLQGLLAVHHGQAVRSRSDLTSAAEISAIEKYLRLFNVIQIAGANSPRNVCDCKTSFRGC